MPASTASAFMHASRPPPPKKRKLDANEQKFYAVRAGKKPGVYTLWVDCQAQISGFTGAQFKSFSSYEDAANWAAGREISTSEPTRFYGVARGKKPGVYTDWTVCQQQIVGFKGPKYKRFETRGEAELFVRTFTNPATQPLNPEPQGDGDEEEEDDEDDEDEEDEEDGADEVEDNFLGLPSKRLKMMHGSQDPGMCVIYTDGSSLGNGMMGARAGAGVYFGPGDPRNTSERIQGEPQTNQRGELTAILRALEVAGDALPVEIRTDSKYSIQCITEWYMSWAKNDWLKRDGGAVKNSDLVKAIRVRMDAREALGTHTHLQWVKGHATDPGNFAADELARQGAAKNF